MSAPPPEPWLRGPLENTSAFVAPLARSFEQVREDLAKFTAGLTQEQLWTEPAPGVGSVGFQLRHIAGSIDRLSTYLDGRQLSEPQWADLRREHDPGATLIELLAWIDSAMSQCVTIARQITDERLPEPRAVGKKALPSTAIGLIVHIAEHTQRHCGQAIVSAKLVRAKAG